MEGLNLKQQKFIEFYLESGNGTEALKRAGYKTKDANKYASELLNKPAIRAYLDKTRQKMNATSELTCEYKLQVLHDGIKHYTAIGEYSQAAKLIEVSNKMQGHNAPDKSINKVTVSHEDALKELE